MDDVYEVIASAAFIVLTGLWTAIQVTGARESFEGLILALAGLYAATGFTVAASALLLVRRQGVRPVQSPT